MVTCPFAPDTKRHDAGAGDNLMADLMIELTSPLKTYTQRHDTTVDVVTYGRADYRAYVTSGHISDDVFTPTMTSHSRHNALSFVESS